MNHHVVGLNDVSWCHEDSRHILVNMQSCAHHQSVYNDSVIKYKGHRNPSFVLVANLCAGLCLAGSHCGSQPAVFIIGHHEPNWGKHHINAFGACANGSASRAAREGQPVL